MCVSYIKVTMYLTTKASPEDHSGKPKYYISYTETLLWLVKVHLSRDFDTEFLNSWWGRSSLGTEESARSDL